MNHARKDTRATAVMRLVHRIALLVYAVGRAENATNVFPDSMVLAVRSHV